MPASCTAFPCHPVNSIIEVFRHTHGRPIGKILGQRGHPSTCSCMTRALLQPDLCVDGVQMEQTPWKTIVSMAANMMAHSASFISVCKFGRGGPEPAPVDPNHNLVNNLYWYTRKNDTFRYWYIYKCTHNYLATKPISSYSDYMKDRQSFTTLVRILNGNLRARGRSFQLYIIIYKNADPDQNQLVPINISFKCNINGIWSSIM